MSNHLQFCIMFKEGNPRYSNMAYS